MSQPHALIIAFHFPPCCEGSGHLRTLALVDALTLAGWQVTVLTACEPAYQLLPTDQNFSLPSGVKVIRSKASDIKVTCSRLGRYPEWMALPDRWSSWIRPASKAALKHHCQQPFSIIYSTYPVASAHKIAFTLKQKLNLPWIADYRDPMLQSDYPRSRLLKRSFRKLDQQVVSHAAAVVLNTTATQRLYQRFYRHSGIAKEKFHAIPNGYDGTSAPARAVSSPKQLRLIHAGQIDPSERDPSALFQALTQFRHRFFTLLFGSGHEELYQQQAALCQLIQMIQISPRVGPAELQDNYNSCHIGLILQGQANRLQVPAKLFEYVREKMPVLALCSPSSATWNLVEEHHLGVVADINNASAIEAALEELSSHFEQYQEQLNGSDNIKLSRAYQQKKLMRLMQETVMAPTYQRQT